MSNLPVPASETCTSTLVSLQRVLQGNIDIFQMIPTPTQSITGTYLTDACLLLVTGSTVTSGISGPKSLDVVEAASGSLNHCFYTPIDYLGPN